MELKIGEKIAKYRKLKGYTQEQLGELVGVSGQAVSKWENGGVPDIYLLPSISKVFGVSIFSPILSSIITSTASLSPV